MAAVLQFRLNDRQVKYTITQTKTSLGRSKANNLCLDGCTNSVLVSARHAEIHWRDGSFVIKDLQSTNGTFLNNRRISEAPLANGERITLGLGGPSLEFLITEATQEIRSKKTAITPLESPGQDNDVVHSTKKANIPFPISKAKALVRSLSLKARLTLGFLFVVASFAIFVHFFYYPDVDDQLEEVSKLSNKITMLENEIDKTDNLYERDIKIKALKQLSIDRSAIILSLPEISQPKEDLLDKMIKEILTHFHMKDYDIPHLFSDRVRHFLDFYSKKIRQRTVDALRRSKLYMPDIRRIFSEKNLPIELAYIAFVESEFKPQALNQRSKARGMWQFMAPTARDHGLIVNDQIDERIDPLKSTVAAREYLLDLISVFGIDAFMLVLASYNAGDAIIRGRLKTIPDPIKSRDFWYLVRMGVLKEETENYIPKFIAANILAKYPERFGLE